MIDLLGNRQKQYEEVSNDCLMRRVPLIARVDGRAFRDVCRKLTKPYEPILLETMAFTMLSVVSQIPGVVFAYQQSDEISFVIRNDQQLDSQAWFGNRIQKIASILASETTYAFNEQLAKTTLPLVGRKLFDCRVFTVPDLSEATNNIIWRQKDCMRNAISGATQVFLSKNKNKDSVNTELKNKSSEDKLNLLKKYGIEFSEEYPASFRRGVAAYRVPTLLAESQIMRNKWILDWNLPDFVKQRDFLYNILNTGHDVFRANNFEFTY